MDNTPKILHGRVTKRNYNTGTVSVTLPDYDNAEILDLTVGQLPHGAQVYEGLPAIGDPVLVVLPSNGSADGVVLCTYPTSQAMPALRKPNTTAWYTRDGKNVIEVSDTGDVTISLESLAAVIREELDIVAASIKLVGNVTVLGNLTVSGDINKA